MAQRWLAQHPGPRLRAVHIDHNLQTDASRWREFCARLCAEKGVPLKVYSITVTDASGQGLEGAARLGRYGVFEAELAAGDCLLLAHHADDQVETVLQRLFRGTGPRGIVGMPAVRRLGQGTLHRPLIEVSRSILTDWVGAQGLQFVDDPSNLDPAYDRGMLRSSLLPVVADRWPAYRDSITRFTRLQRDMLEGLPALEVAQSHFGESVLSLPSSESVGALATRIHRWLNLGGVLSPGYRRLQEFARQCLEAKEGAQPRLSLDEGEIVCWRAQLYLSALDQPVPALPEVLTTGDSLAGRWGSLNWLAQAGKGLKPGLAATLRFRRPGERVTPVNGATKDFGQLCQERGVPPWWRDRLPILEHAGEPVWAPLLGFFAGAAPYLATSGEGVTPHWQPPNCAE